jgi:mannosyltransferase OCH1-like enzyme
MNCLECGAPETLCQERFDEFLVLEFTDAAYGAVHHLTVTAYMLQHSSKLTREGWLYERELLNEFLVENKPPAFIRKQNKDLVDNGKRTFKIKSRDGVPIIHKTTWKRTILDVRVENAQVYCEDVKAWARSVLVEAEALAV